MKLAKVDPRTIKVPELRVTASFDPEVLEQFRESMKETGQIAPPICYNVDGELVLCDGLHRLQEAIDNGVPAIDVAVLEGDMIDVLTKNIFLDHLRGKTLASEMVLVIKALAADHGLDVDQIRERTGLTRDYIERLIRIGEASDLVVQALDQGLIGVGHAFEISRLPFAAQQEEVIAKQSVYRFPVKDLKAQIDLVLAEMENMNQETPEAAPAVARTPSVPHCEGCKKAVETKYLRAIMACPECFGILFRHGKAAEEEAAAGGEEPGGG